MRAVNLLPLLCMPLGLSLARPSKFLTPEESKKSFEGVLSSKRDDFCPICLDLCVTKAPKTRDQDLITYIKISLVTNCLSSLYPI